MKDERAHLQLFDLIAREWLLPSPIQHVSFNRTNTAVAFDCADGSVHIAAVADKEAPNLRIRRAVDTGRLTIAPRAKPFAGVKSADFTEGRSSSVVAHGPVNFAFAKETGRINTLTPGGTAVHLPPKSSTAITALTASADGETISYASGMDVFLAPKRGGSVQQVCAIAPVTALAFSPDETRLAVAHKQGVALFCVDALDNAPQEIGMETPLSITWRDDGALILCCLETDGFCVIDAATGSVRHHGSFPAPVRSASFGLTTNTVVASGAFRVAAWSLDDDSPLVSGKAGLVLVDCVAACPTRNLVAIGYANGLLSMAEIGQPSEILLREDTGAGIAAMAWSSDGNYLALGGTDGTAALVEFPDSMFKS